MPVRLSTDAEDFDTSFAAFLDMKRDVQEDVGPVVGRIIGEVRARGDEALADYTERFDRVRLSAAEFRVTDDQVAAARESCDPSTRGALELAAERIEAYHRRQRPEDLDYRDAAGVRLGHRWTAVAAAGLYVPGGTAAYPSSVLMNAVPARVAGVERIVMTVPTPDGQLNPLVLVAADLAGVHEIYRVGGAQAVGALAYGTETIAAVDKIVGPGNAYVAEAKRQVFGIVGIDLIAGPSEILVLADAENDPSWIAADLLSQAEHDEVAQSILITDDRRFAAAVEAAVAEQVERLPRSATARASWDSFGAVIVVPDLEAAIPLIDKIAPEHLEIAVRDPDAIAGRIRNAGAMFLGRSTPEAIGEHASPALKANFMPLEVSADVFSWDPV